MGFSIFMIIIFGVLIIAFTINKASINARGDDDYDDIVIENDLTLFLKRCTDK